MACIQGNSSVKDSPWNFPLSVAFNEILAIVIALVRR